MPSTLITGANRGLGLSLRVSICVMAGRSTRLVAIQLPLRSYVIWRRTAAGDCGFDNGCSRLRRSAQSGDTPVDGQAIDLLINNAGIIGPQNQTIGNIDYDAWADVFTTNTMGPLRVTEAFVENVARSDHKLIVTLTSGMGSIGDNSSGGSILYRSSKAAVNMVMRSLAIDLAPRGITCVVVNPGWVQTDMGGPKAHLQPTESINALRRLIATLSPEHSGKFLNHTGREYPW